MSPLCHHSLWGRKARKRLGKAKSEIRPRSIPKSDWGLVRAWCGPGAGLAILGWAQDCPSQSCCGQSCCHSRIAPAHYQQLCAICAISYTPSCGTSTLPGFLAICAICAISYTPSRRTSTLPQVLAICAICAISYTPSR